MISFFPSTAQQQNIISAFELPTLSMTSKEDGRRVNVVYGKNINKLAVVTLFFCCDVAILIKGSPPHV